MSLLYHVNMYLEFLILACTIYILAPDFVVNQSSQRYYIQVAYDMTSEEKQTQELNSFRNIPDSFKKIVIVNGTKKPWRNEEGFVIMGMKYFLLNEDSLEF